MKSMELVRYLPEYFEPMLELHRDAKVGLTIGISQHDGETDLRAVLNEVLVYYGAADSVVNVATAKIGDLVPEEFR